MLCNYLENALNSDAYNDVLRAVGINGIVPENSRLASLFRSFNKPIANDYTTLRLPLYKIAGIRDVALDFISKIVINGKVNTTQSPYVSDISTNDSLSGSNVVTQYASLAPLTFQYSGMSFGEDIQIRTIMDVVHEGIRPVNALARAFSGTDDNLITNTTDAINNATKEAEIIASEIDRIFGGLVNAGSKLYDVANNVSIMGYQYLLNGDMLSPRIQNFIYYLVLLRYSREPITLNVYGLNFEDCLLTDMTLTIDFDEKKWKIAWDLTFTSILKIGNNTPSFISNEVQKILNFRL